MNKPLSILFLLSIIFLSGCTTFWDFMDLWEEEDPKKAIITMEDGTVYEAVEIK